LPRFRQEFFETFFELLSKTLAQNPQRTFLFSGVFEAPSVEGSADNAFDVFEHKMFFQLFDSIVISLCDSGACASDFLATPKICPDWQCSRVC
jgi:hypothetical protein